MRGFLLILLVLPAVAAEPTTLFVHTDDWFDDGVLATQEPPEEWIADVGYSSGLLTNTCLPDGLPVASPNHQSWTSWSSPTGVRYETNQDGDLYVWGTRGLAANMSLASGTLHWYLSTFLEDAVPSPGANSDAELPLVPALRLDTTLYLAPNDFGLEAPPEGSAAFATGSVGPLTLAADATTGANHTMVGERHVYHVAIPLTFTQNDLDVGTPNSYGAGRAIVLEVSVRHDVACPAGSGTLKTPTVRAHSSPGLRPRLELEADNPIRLSYQSTRILDDAMVFRAEYNSAWGKYDIDPLSLTLDVKRPDGQTIPVWLASNGTALYHEHSPRDRLGGAGPLEAAWVWNTTAPPPGTYTLAFHAATLDGLHVGTDIDSFTIDAQPSPDAGPLLLVLLAGCGLLARRGKKS
ncbi:MAG: hypothetical protein AABX89_03760 [Candidatus Thermoplasmatota archaeon]